MIWQPRSDSEVSGSPTLSMPPVLWRALSSRGFTEKEIQDLFSPSLQNLKDPFSLKNMQKTCDRLVQAFQKNEKITIYADFDLDGTSGLALLYEGMISLGFQNVFYYQPKRLSEGYGLHVHAMEELALQGTKIIVTVDVGITALDAACRAKELGIDLIITDHHLPYEQLPEAFAIVNPNQKECTSGLGYLCGAGVAFFLLMALKKTMHTQGHLKNDFNLKDVLDFFVIGTLTDLVPLVADNRVLVRHGLIKLSQTQRPALKLLLDSLGLSERVLSSQEVAINLAPKLNALSRMEAEFLPRDVFLEKQIHRAKEIIDHVLKTQELRKYHQKSAMNKALELVSELSQEGYIWVWSHEFHKGIIGLVATSLCETYRVPTFVGSINQDGEIAGSARLPDGIDLDLTKILEKCSQCLMKYGGHAQAAGFSLKSERALAFDESLKKYFNENPTETKDKVFYYDAKARFEDMSRGFMRWIEGLEPFGKEFPALQFLFDNIIVTKIRSLNGGHLKLYLQQDGRVMETVIFSPSEKFKSLKLNDCIDIIGEPKWNHFNGVRTLQILMKDFCYR